MTLRAADKKDEHGWQIYRDDALVAHAASRDKARAFARGEPGAEVTYMENGSAPAVQVLPADDSPEAIAARAAWDVDQRIKASIRKMRAAWVDLAADLYIFHQNEMWKALGAASWEAYFADPDVSISPKYAYDQVAVYQQLVIQRGVDPELLKTLEVSKVTKVLPAVRRDQVSIDEALSDARVLARSDLEIKYSGRFQPQKANRGRPDTSTKVHTESEGTWAVCPTCGTRKQIDPQTGEWV